jgi:hypothetical protein
MVTPEHHLAVVDHLVESSVPVRRMWPVRVRMGIFLSGGLAGALLVALTWPRPDLSLKLRDATFVRELAVLALATGFMTLMALRCAVPGRAPSRIESLVAIGLVIVAAGAFAMGSTGVPALDGWLCSLRTIAFAIVPWTLLLLAIRRGAPVRVRNAALYAGAAALLYATTVSRLACPADGPRHWLTWHAAVVPLFALLTTPFATRWLQGWRHA